MNWLLSLVFATVGLTTITQNASVTDAAALATKLLEKTGVDYESAVVEVSGLSESDAEVVCSTLRQADGWLGEFLATVVTRRRQHATGAGSFDEQLSETIATRTEDKRFARPKVGFVKVSFKGHSQTVFVLEALHKRQIEERLGIILLKKLREGERNDDQCHDALLGLLDRKQTPPSWATWIVRVASTWSFQSDSDHLLESLIDRYEASRRQEVGSRAMATRPIFESQRILKSLPSRCRDRSVLAELLEIEASIARDHGLNPSDWDDDDDEQRLDTARRRLGSLQSPDAQASATPSDHLERAKLAESIRRMRNEQRANHIWTEITRRLERSIEAERTESP